MTIICQFCKAIHPSYCTCLKANSLEELEEKMKKITIPNIRSDNEIHNDYKKLIKENC